MEKNKQCIVVMPIHSDTPTVFEQISFKQCFDIVKNNRIVAVIPRGLNLEKYKNIVPNFEFIEINPKWQSSIEMYNKLKLSDYFYSLFADYEYLLTYELDSFIFKDEIEYWCNKQIDYIGAPWFKGHTDINATEIIGVGNSGFSLRKIKEMRNAIKNIHFIEHKHFSMNKRRRLISHVKQLINSILNLVFENKTVQKARHFNEDWFVSKIIPYYMNDFKVASVEDAVQFSFEVNPRLLFEKNKSKLPMGCHAWEKYDILFWKPYINQFGHSI
jgi:hypothetical protein